MLDCRHELENTETELKRLQQEVRRIKRETVVPSDGDTQHDLLTSLQITQIIPHPAALNGSKN